MKPVNDAKGENLEEEAGLDGQADLVTTQRHGRVAEGRVVELEPERGDVHFEDGLFTQQLDIDVRVVEMLANLPDKHWPLFCLLNSIK